MCDILGKQAVPRRNIKGQKSNQTCNLKFNAHDRFTMNLQTTHSRVK